MSYNMQLRALLAQAVRYIEVQQAYTRAMAVDEIEKAVLKNRETLSVVQIAHSGPPLASFNLRAARDLLDRATETPHSKRQRWLVAQVHEQKVWMENCGWNLAGYINHYGDPGLPECYGNGGTEIYRADLAALNAYEREAGVAVTLPSRCGRERCDPRGAGARQVRHQHGPAEPLLQRSQLLGAGGVVRVEAHVQLGKSGSGRSVLQSVPERSAPRT